MAFWWYILVASHGVPSHSLVTLRSLKYPAIGAIKPTLSTGEVAVAAVVTAGLMAAIGCIDFNALRLNYNIPSSPLM